MRSDYNYLSVSLNAYLGPLEGKYTLALGEMLSDFFALILLSKSHSIALEMLTDTKLPELSGVSTTSEKGII